MVDLTRSWLIIASAFRIGTDNKEIFGRRDAAVTHTSGMHKNVSNPHLNYSTVSAAEAYSRVTASDT
jgi:hypothetical protein